MSAAESESAHHAMRTQSHDACSSGCDLVLDRLASNAAKYPDKLALNFVGPGENGGVLLDKRTYQQLERETDSLAVHLLSTGLSPGDRAVLVYPPGLDFMICFLACLKAGVVAVPVFPPNPLRRDTLQMFSVIVAACGATTAFTTTSYNHQTKLISIKDSLTRFKHRTASWPDSLRWIATDKSDKRKSSKKSLLKIERSGTAFLQFTSGSTTDPKGVMITHDNLAHNLTIITNELKAVNDTVVASWLPLYHDMGLIGSFLGCIYCGGTGYYLSPVTFLQRPAVWVEVVSKYRATHLQAPNFAFKLTARKFDPTTESSKTLDLSSVRHVINAAEPVDEDSLLTFYATFSPYGLRKVIFPTYGLAEHSVFVCSGGKQVLRVLKRELEIEKRVVLAANAEDESAVAITKLVGCGYPGNQNVDARIVDPETLEDLQEDSVGEIWVNSPSKASGYYGKPAETADDFHAKLSQAETNTEYLRTGDLGFLHNNELFICGRRKDLIIVAGRNYYPQDIEATAEASTGLVRLGCSAAFTIDQMHAGGEEVALVMELKEVPDANSVESVCLPLANSIRYAINQEHSLGIASILFLKPRTVPKTSSGKIARAWCRKGYLDKSLQTVYEKSLKLGSPVEALEIEQTNGTSAVKATGGKKDARKIREMSKSEIKKMLTNDISRLSSIPFASVEHKLPLVAILDSLTISQFKGMLENNYSVKISDEYLFRESTTVTKLVEVVKLGYAPDDADSQNTAAMAVGPGQSRGLAGALGCPPGVVCVIQ